MTNAPSAAAGLDAPVSGRPLAVELLLAGAAWGLAVVAVATVHLESPWVQQAALFVHVVALAAGFGGVLAVDVHGLLWLLGRRTSRDLVAMVTGTHPVITAGVAGLLASGAVLHPDLTSLGARVKLALVLVVVLNGVNTRRFADRLQAIPADVAGDAIPWRYLPRALSLAIVSQAAWWGALVIGFATTAARH